jgi:hypothetical protein
VFDAVSIQTPGVEADIWTPVAQQVGVPIEINRGLNDR